MVQNSDGYRVGGDNSVAAYFYIGGEMPVISKKARKIWDLEFKKAQGIKLNAEEQAELKYLKATKQPSRSKTRRLVVQKKKK